MWLHGRHEHRVTREIAIGRGGYTHEGDGGRCENHARTLDRLGFARWTCSGRGARRREDEDRSEAMLGAGKDSDGRGDR